MKCRACGCEELVEVLDMGYMPLAGDFNAGFRAKRYPLAIDCCKTCLLLQVRELVSHSIIFNSGYCYASSTVPALVEHFRALAKTLAPDARVLDIGCNDGPLLRPLTERGVKAVGVDASQNVVDLAKQAGCIAYCDTFSRETAVKALPYNDNQLYDIVTCSNVFAHNEEPSSITDGVKQILSKKGVFIVEVHDARKLHELLQWDCFYHEHCFYWSPKTLELFLRTQGFWPVGVQELPMHGGAFRMYSVYTGVGALGNHLPQAKELTLDDWQAFTEKAKRSRDALNTVINGISFLRLDNVGLIGAAGRATTLVNWAELTGIQTAYDGSPLRIGKQVPGTTIPILDEKLLLATKADSHKEPWGLLGAWHLKEALVKKFAASFKHFISPLPNATIF